MREKLSHEIENGRILFGHYGSPPNSGPIGAFRLVHPKTGGLLAIIACSAEVEGTKGWEHVSVSLEDRCPTWEEMHWIKTQFWEPEECCFQLHPPESEYLNFHPFALHIWRNINHPIPTPPSAFVA